MGVADAARGRFGPARPVGGAVVAGSDLGGGRGRLRTGRGHLAVRGPARGAGSGKQSARMGRGARCGAGARSVGVSGTAR